MLSAPSPKPSPRQRKTHLPAIAIDNYTDGPGPLSYPVAECERLLHFLAEEFEFEERHIINRLYDGMATQENLYDELYNLEDKLNAGHNLILIFSGHGHLDEKKGEGYWLPVDAPKIEQTERYVKIHFARSVF
ncbi:MAG: caspase family protein [Saprospirales bacterium]|nr:caspase family protein [Saprospirales bacterium]